MKERTRRLGVLYSKVRREMIEKSVYDLVISDERNYIKYDPKYQRRYIWNITKAVNLIETILINGEIPPMTAIKNGKKIEIIDRETKIWNIIKTL